MKVTDAAMKKDIETEFKPVVSRQAGASQRHFWDQFDQDASQAS